MKNKKDLIIKNVVMVIFTVMLLASIFALSVIIGNADTFYTIRINYLFADDTPAHDPYIATYQASEDPLHLVVTNPKITGYDPMTAVEDGLLAETTTIELEHIDRNVELDVYYLAGLTSYRVMYYKQNIYDDLYTRDNTISSEYTNRRGKTGTNPTELENENLPGYEGFTNLFHEPDAIAADGSTVFRVYYDRNYYHVLFDLGSGGYGVEPVYAKYQSVYHISEPKRPGYNFVGWARTDKDSTHTDDWKYIDSNGNEITEEYAMAHPVSLAGDQTIPAEDTYYKALWIQGTTKYSVVYWIQKADATVLDPEELQSLPRSEAQALIGSNYSVVASKDFEGITSGTLVNLTTTVQNAQGTSMSIKDFFSYNLNAQDDVINGKPVDENDNYIDFPDISDAQRVELTGNQKYYYDFNQVLSLLQFEGESDISVSGDGTTRINVYYDRAEFTLKFYYAKEDSSGNIYLTNGTGGFSRKSDKNLRTRLNGASWQKRNVSLPTIDPKYSAKIPASCLGVDTLSGDKFHYYEMKCRYGANMNDVWFNDSFSIIPGGAGGVPYRFTSWAVEYGTKFYYDHITPNNYTVKGFYEKLSKDLMFRDYNANGTATQVANGYSDRELHYVASWSGVASGNNSDPYCFTYKNYVRLLPYEDDIITDMGYDDGVAELISSGNYIDIITNNGRYYGLTENNKVETFDWGSDRYSGKTGRSLALAVQGNQTAVDLTGFTLVPDSEVEEMYTGCGNLNPQSTWYAYDIDGDGTNDFSNKRHADVVFLYSRNAYTLHYRNFNVAAESYEAYYDAPLNQANFSYTPTYPYPERADYYQFAGWYYTPYYYRQVDFSTAKMPADDVTLYAKWVPKTITVSFYPTYNDYYENVNRIGDEIPIDYGDYVPHELIPANIEGSERPKLNPPATGAMFAGWYYLRDNIPVRFEPENLPVTALNQESSGENATFHLYAEWVTKEVGKYQIKYVEKNNHNNEVASPTIGRAFVWKTRTFNAKGGSDLNAEHAWQEGGINWWPVVNSHSLVIKANDHATSDYSPNEYTFEYIQKSGVWYSVHYLDAVTHTPLADPVERYTTDASVKEDALFIPGYVAEEMTKSRVLAASEKTGTAAMAEELENNVINFYYNQNSDEYLYEVEYYGQNVDDDNYELIQTENIEVQIGDDPDTPEVEPTTVALSTIYNRHYCTLFAANGFERVTGATKQVVANLDGSTTTTSLPDNASFNVTSDRKTTIQVYFDRKTYSYTYRYVDHQAEREYLALDESERDGKWDGVMETHNSTVNERVEKEVTIPAPTDLTYNNIPYTRVSDNDVVLMIAPDENNPEVNIINVYYRKFDERELQYKLVCKDSPYNELDYDDTKNPPQPLYGGLSMTVQTVDVYEEIQSVNFYDFNEAFDPDADPSLPANERYLHNHRYTFLGWFDNPEGTGTPVSADANLSPAEMVGNTEELPARNTTYYAVVEQDMVHANFEFRYVEEPLPVGGDSGETEEDRQAALIVSNAPTDTDGSNTGHVFNFTNPNDYTSGDPIPWERTLGYNATVDPVDGRVYKYEFAEWWEEDLTPGENYGKLIRKKNWNSDGEWSPTVLQQVLDRRSDKHVIAVFVRRQVNSLPYNINYVFTDRTGAERTYTVKGVLTGDELIETSANAKVNSSGAYELTNKFIMDNAPYETNYGETLLWTDTETVKDSFKGDSEQGTVDRMVTTVTAQQSTKKVVLNYRLSPTGAYTTVGNIDYGANRKSDENVKKLTVTGDTTYNGKYFTYWAIRKTPGGKVIAKCYSPEFTMCMMDSYYITPVFETSASEVKTAILNPDKVKTGEEDWLAWTWSSEDDGTVVIPNEDLVFTGLKDNVVFVRVASGVTELGDNWANALSRTSDLTTVDGKTYTLTSMSGSSMDGTWANVVLTHLDYTRNRWTNEDGEMFANGNTDLLYTDFEIAFEDGGEHLNGRNSQYKAGVVFELCARWDPANEFDQDHDYGYASDEANLKAAIAAKSSVYYYKDGKRRSIMQDEFSGSELTNQNRIVYSKPYKNAYKETVDPSTGETIKTYTNSTYLMKATAYLTDPDGNITLSNSVYVCLTDIAGCDLATGGMTEYTED